MDGEEVYQTNKENRKSVDKERQRNASKYAKRGNGRLQVKRKR